MMEVKPDDTVLDGQEDGRGGGWKNMGFCSKVKYVLGNITVEPLLALFQVSSVLSSLTTQNLNLQKACRVNLRLDDDVCHGLENKNITFFADQEVQVQQMVSDMLIWQTVIQSSIPCVLVIFIGSWSDRHGKRKPLMIVPIVGELVRNAGLILCVYYFNELKMEVAGLVESIPTSLAGGITVLYMAAFSYIGDRSSIKNRTVRIGLMNLFFGTAWPLGAALSGILFQKLGYYGVYYISTSLYTVALFYGLIHIKEQPKMKKENNIIQNPKSSYKFISDFFNINHLKEAFHVTFKISSDKKWIRLYILIFTIIMVHGPTQGEMAVGYLFTRVRFNWNEFDFSIFVTFLFILMIVGNAFAVGVLSHVLKIDDAIIGMISCISKILAGFVYAFAPSSQYFYFGAVIDVMNGSSHIIVRSILSKIVSQAELGQVTAVIAVIETLVPVIYKPMYSTIYRATVDTFPGAFYVIGSIMLIPSLFLYWWMYRINKDEEKENMIN